MAKLSLSDVSKKFHVDRSTIYRAVGNGRLSRSSDGQFDLAEVTDALENLSKHLNKLNLIHQIAMNLQKNSLFI